MSRIVLLALAGVLGLAAATAVTAQTRHADTPAAAATTKAAAQVDARKPATTRPDERHCLRQTGSLIRAKRGHCLSGVSGRSYSADELRGTGQIDTADALRALDPAIH